MQFDIVRALALLIDTTIAVLFMLLLMAAFKKKKIPFSRIIRKSGGRTSRRRSS